eukprot:gene9697-1902_t
MNHKFQKIVEMNYVKISNVSKMEYMNLLLMEEIKKEIGKLNTNIKYQWKGNTHYRLDFQGAYNNDENVRMGNIQFQVGNSSHECILYPVECKDATLLR